MTATNHEQIKGQPKVTTIKFRCSQAQRARIIAVAESFGVSISFIMRKALETGLAQMMGEGEFEVNQ